MAEPTTSGAEPILLCTDGSEAAIAALRTGLALLAVDAPLIVVAVIPEADMMDLTGTGFAGGTITQSEFDAIAKADQELGRTAVESARTELGLADVETVVVPGAPGPVICQLAEDRGARAIVMGTRGLGRIRRVLLGSVADHVVRNAPCTVVVSRDDLTDD